MGIGAGDLNIKAECRLVSEIFGVQDCRFFDVSSSENVSKYGSSSAFSYDSTEQAYYISTSSAKNITRDSVVGDFDFCCEMDFKLQNGDALLYLGESTSGYECQGEFTRASSYKRISTFYTDTSRSITNRTNRQNYELSSSVWYHCKVTRVGNTLNVKVFNGDTAIIDVSDTNVVGTSKTIQWHLYVAYGNLYWKNIKFKPL